MGYVYYCIFNLLKLTKVCVKMVGERIEFIIFYISTSGALGSLRVVQSHFVT